jgi:hypothetical protein
MGKDTTRLDAVVACADLVARTGAREFELGYLDDDVPVEKARWYAHAKYRGARLTCEEQASPEAAADGLAHRLLDGGICTGCNGLVGTECRWHRDGTAWVRGCDGKRKATRR